MIFLKAFEVSESTGALVDFWNWWRTELLGFLKSRANESDTFSHVVHVNRDEYRIAPSGDGGNLVDVISALTRLKTSGRAKSHSVGLVLGTGRYVERPLAALRLPCTTAAAIARLDVEAATPFRSDDVLTCLESEARGLGAKRYFLIKRSVVEPLQAALRDNGFRISSVHIETIDGPVEIVLPNAENGLDLRRIVTAAFTAAAFCLLIFAVSNLWLKAHAANLVLQEKEALMSVRLEKLKPEFQKQRQAETLLNELRARNKNTAVTTAILEALTTVLPDDTYLENVVIDGKTLTIAGYSNDAPPLIATLEKDALFSGVSFAAPTSKIPGKDGDRFEIGMRLGR